MAYFPMFVDLTNKDCLIIGGGKIAFHKIGVLKPFSPELTVIAPEISLEIREKYGEDEHVHLICREVKKEDVYDKVGGWQMVVSATDDSALNHKVSTWCVDRKIPVNAVDQPEDCSFIFPSYVKEGNVVAAFSSGGNSPVITQYLKEHSKEYLTEFLGEIADYLGSIRGEVKADYATLEERKAVYKKILEESIEKGELRTLESLNTK